MTVKKILIVFVFIISYGCSNNNDQEIIVQQPQIEPNSAEIFINGQIATYNDIANKKFLKVEDEFYIIDNSQIYKLISFNKNGKFGSFRWNYYDDDTSTFKWFYSYRPYSSNFFKLNIEEIDEVNKKIKINFNGEMYSDPNSLQSEGKYVNGRIVANYIEIIPSILGLKNTAKINGEDWIRTNSVQVNSGITNYPNRCIQNEYNDKEFKIKIYYQVGTTVAGTYNFTPSDQIHKVEISKYDLISNSYINYDCTGQLKILYTFERQINGEYSFTGVNPNNPLDVVTVTNGQFKIISLY